MPGHEVRNKQVKLKRYAPVALQETDMEVTSTEVTLELKEGTHEDVLVKNLYLSCDPYMRHRLTGLDYSHHPSFKTGQVSRLSHAIPLCAHP
jgi:NADPH-dependent curcumin reductase CurA